MLQGLKNAGIQVYSKGSYQVENHDYHSRVKTKVLLFITKSYFPIFDTRPYVGESITY